MANHIPELREKANRLPLLPGVYIMLDESAEVIYVGKAKRLKNRVSSYFHGEHLPKVAAMVSHVADFHVIIAESEFEALVLENSLIKLHKPHYNILLKDDKGFPFIRLDVKSPYPRMSLRNRAENDGARYFGPFGSRGQSNAIIDAVSKALGLPDCSRVFPRDLGKGRPCLQYQMGACRGWCRGEPSQLEYSLAIAQLILILEGRSGEVGENIRAEMEQAAEELRFEDAAKLRNRYRAVSTLENRQRVIAAARSDTDAVALERGAKACFAVLHYTEGDLTGKDYSLFPDPMEDNAEALSELLRQYYVNRNPMPWVILLPFDIEDREDIARFLSQQAGHKVSIEHPQRGDKAAFVDKARINAREEILRATTREERGSHTLEWLQKTLSLPDMPKRIEAYDISNTGDSDIVSSMIVFQDGKPKKSEYRKFRMKTVEHQDDYGSMAETITRRFTHYIEGDARFASRPDLLLIDGGAEHASAAETALNALGLCFPVYGMVKDDRHRTRALITSQGQEIGIQSNPAAFALIGRIQEEVHRFAIAYHRKLRDSVGTSDLEKIRGVGEKRRQALLKTFGSIKKIRAASLSELEKAVPKSTALAVYNYYHQEEESCE